MTRPRLPSVRDAITDIGKAAGRDIDFVSVPIEDYTATLTEYGLPQVFSDYAREPPRRAGGQFESR